MKNLLAAFSLLIFLGINVFNAQETDNQEHQNIYQLIERILPGKSSQFIIEDLENKASRDSIPTPSVLGISIDAINVQRADTDRVQSKFRTGQFENPPEDGVEIDGQDV